jgi:hypothetical protein
MATAHQLITGETPTDDPAWQLRRYPTAPLVDWPVLNSRRPDVHLSRDWQAAAAAPGGETRHVINRGVLPADEALTRGSCDFLTSAGGVSVDGGGGRSVRTKPLDPGLLDAPLLQPDGMSLCGAARLCARRAAAGLGALDTGAAVCTKDVARGASAIDCE